MKTSGSVTNLAIFLVRLRNRNGCESNVKIGVESLTVYGKFITFFNKTMSQRATWLVLGAKTTDNCFVRILVKLSAGHHCKIVECLQKT